MFVIRTSLIFIFKKYHVNVGSCAVDKNIFDIVINVYNKKQSRCSYRIPNN